MRILHIDPDDMDNPLSGGGPVRTFEICRRLARRHEVTVLTPTFPGSTPEKVRDGVRYVRLGRKVRNHGSSHHITFMLALPQAVRRYDYDLLVEDFMPPAAATWTPIFSRRRPLIASVQWFMAETWSRQLKLPFWLGERYGIRMYDNFVVLTEAMKQLIESRHAKARCVVLPNGVPEELFQLDLLHGDFILYIGRIDCDDKGLDLLLEAYAKLPEGKRLPLLVAGNGVGEADFQARAERLGLLSSIRMLGKVDAAQRAELMRTCRFTVMPSRVETFGMTILEACAAGKRALIFDQWPMNEVAAPACPRVPAFDVDAYAQAMAALIDAPAEEMLTAGESCRTWARRYDWNEIAAQQEAFYESVVEDWNTKWRRRRV